MLLVLWFVDPSIQAQEKFFCLLYPRTCSRHRTTAQTQVTYLGGLGHTVAKTCSGTLVVALPFSKRSVCDLPFGFLSSTATGCRSLV